MSILLTDDEIVRGAGGKLHTTPDVRWKAYQGIAKAQLKKVGEWGGGVCPHIAVMRHSDAPRHQRYECNVCWQALLKEVEDV